MEEAEVVERIRKVTPNAEEIKVEGADCNFTAVIVSPSFEGLNLLKRQQLVLAGFSDCLATGELHALTIKAYTQSEWQAFNQSSLTQISL
ncbi:BolA family protein [Aurantivibrio plasticivorans]